MGVIPLVYVLYIIVQQVYDICNALPIPNIQISYLIRVALNKPKTIPKSVINSIPLIYFTQIINYHCIRIGFVISII